MQEAVIVDCLRTPSAKRRKARFDNTRPDDMAAAVIRALAANDIRRCRRRTWTT